MKLKTKKQIINETFNYYNKNPKKRRSLMRKDTFDELSVCVYNGKNNTHCAVGRLFTNEYKNQGKNFDGNTLNIHDLTIRHSGIDKLLKPSYAGHPIHFWIDLQILHDDEDYWYDDKATDAGHVWKRTLHRKWNKR